MEVIRMEKVAMATTKRGVAGRKLVDTPAVHVMNLVLGPAEEVPVHTTPVDVLFYVVKGAGTIGVGDEDAAVGETDIVVSPKGIPHSVRADRGQEFQVLVIKTPNPSH